MKSFMFSLVAASMAAAPAIADPRPEPPGTPVAEPAATHCETVDVTLYFSENDASLSAPAAAVLADAADRLSGCAVTWMTATARSADAAGFNETITLAKARAEAVSSAFAEAGLKTKSTRTDVVLRTNDDTPETASPVMARRVDVRIAARRAYSS